MDAKNIGTFLTNLRKKENLLQKDIADLCNVSVQAVSKWERGESVPDIQILEKLSILYKISINEIINGEKHEIYIDTERRNSIFLFTSSVLVFLSYLFNFIKLENTPEFFGNNIVLRGYEVVFNGITGVFVYLTWGQFLILISHLLINIFIMTKVVNRSEALIRYIQTSSILVISLSIIGILFGKFLPFPQVIIFVAMIVNLTLLQSNSELKSIFKKISKEKSEKKLDITSKIGIALLTFVNTLLTVMAVYTTFEDSLLYSQNNAAYTETNITLSVLFVIATIMSILHIKKFNSIDRFLVSVRFGLINMIFPIGLLIMNDLSTTWAAGYIVILLEVVIPLLIIYKQRKANPS